MKNNKAFTLFEILIALTIFAILGVIVAVGLHNALDQNQRVDKINQSVQKIEVAQALIRRDFRQMISRPIIDDDGTLRPAFVLTPTQVEFSKTSIFNPMNKGNLSNIDRIGYQLKNHHLYRLIWPTLDRAINNKPLKIELLDHVDSFQTQIYDDNNQLKTFWPLKSHSSAQTSALPRAVRIDIQLQKLGHLQDIVFIPARGMEQ